MSSSKTYDVTSPAFKANPYPTYAQMQQESPAYCYQHPEGGTSWLITRYKDGEAILRDHKRFVKNPSNVPSTQLAARPPVPEVFTLLFSHMLFQDPPVHTRLRALVSKAFTPHRVSQMLGRVQSIADELLDSVQAQGTMNLIDDFAFPLPIIVICELLGVPAVDRNQFRLWSQNVITPTVTEEDLNTKVQLMTAFADYLRHLFARRRANPTDDLISALLAVEVDGGRLSEMDLCSMVLLLLVAGHETTVNLLGNSTLALLQHPQQLAKLRKNPDLMGAAIEELVRYDGPLERTPVYYVAEDVQIGDVLIPCGDMVEVVLAAVNRDPAVFVNPDTLDLTRSDNKHLGFGTGIHYCLGAPLARLEGQIGLTTLLRRLPQLRLAVAPEQLTWRSESTFLHGLRALPLAWN